MTFTDVGCLWHDNQQSFQALYPRVEQLISPLVKDAVPGIAEMPGQRQTTDFLSKGENIRLLSIILAAISPPDLLTLKRDFCGNRSSQADEAVLREALAWALLLDLLTPLPPESLKDDIAARNGEMSNSFLSSSPAERAWLFEDNTLAKVLMAAEHVLTTSDAISEEWENVCFMLNEAQKAALYTGTILSVTHASQEIMNAEKQVKDMRDEVDKSNDTIYTRIIEICGIMIALFAVICSNLFVLVQANLSLINVLTVNCALVCTLTALCFLLLLITHPHSVPRHSLLTFIGIIAVFAALLAALLFFGGGKAEAPSDDSVSAAFSCVSTVFA